MRSRTVYLAALLSLSVSLLLDAVPSEGPAQDDQSAAAVPLQQRHVGDDVVLIDFIAGDIAGRSVAATTSKELILRDNRKMVSAASWKLVQTGSEQTQVVVVLDALNSSLAEIVRSEDALVHFLEAAGGKLTHAFTILIVSDTEPKTGAASASTALHHRQLFVHRIPTSQDPQVLLQGLKDYRPALQRTMDSQGAAAQGERVRLSLEALSFIANAQKTVPGAKVVAWMSPGWPYLAESDARSSRQLYDSVIYFSDLMRAARLMVYMVNPEGVAARDASSQIEGFELATRPNFNGANTGTARVPQTIDRDYYKSFLKGVARASDADPNDLALQVLAVQSGGLVLPESNDMKAQLNRCIADAGAVVTLAYTPERNKDEYHAIAVERISGGQRLRSRTGLYLR